MVAGGEAQVHVERHRCRSKLRDLVSSERLRCDYRCRGSGAGGKAFVPVKEDQMWFGVGRITLYSLYTSVTITLQNDQMCFFGSLSI